MFKNNIEMVDSFNINDRKIDRGLLCDGTFNLISISISDKDKQIQPLAAAVLGTNNTGIPLPNDVEFHNTWTDSDAQESYLNIRPKCYVILGKQGQGAHSVGEALSKKLNCIHLSPKNMISDEINQKSLTGNCLDFNMKHDNTINFNIIMSILEKKLQSAAVNHRGFVISGFPLVTSDRCKRYKINTLYSEEAICVANDLLYDIIYNLKRKKQKAKNYSRLSSVTSEKDLPVEEEVEEEQEHENEEEEEEKEERIELPQFLLDPCSNLIFSIKTKFETLKSILLMQIQKLLDLQPDILIYISTPDKDTVTKRSRKYINYMNGSKTFHTFAINSDLELRWPTQYVLSDYKKPYDSHTFNPKYNCKQPINFDDNIVNQVCNFKEHMFSFLENKLNEFDPKMVIKLDGRISVHEMIHHTLERLSMLLTKPVLLPEPLYLEEPSDDNEEFWKSVEELNKIRHGNISFNRYASVWFNRCPVELKKRRSVQGNPKYAVTFFNHVYLLASLENMILFCRNPRPFLKLEYMEPTCRVIIIGTRTSGKTLIGNCLSWLFDCPVICYKQFLSQQRQNKYDNYSRTILSEIIATIEDKRFATWEHAELERVSQLNIWYNTVSTILSSYIPLLKEKMASEEPNENILKQYHNIRNQLSFLPIIDDLEQCNHALKDKNLLKYAPVELLSETTKPTVPILGDDDVRKAISAYIATNEMQSEIDPTIEELMTEIIKIIRDIDSKTLTSSGTYGKYIIDGFPSTPEYWEYLSERKLLPDYTISIYENREIDNEIFQHYESIEKSTKNYHERYVSATDVLIKTKLLQKKPTNTTSLDVQMILNDFVINKDNELDDIKVEKNYPELIKIFTEDIEKFREDWDSLKLKLDENFKSFIEIEIEDKSDVQIIDETLLKVRKSYCKPCFVNEDEGGGDNEDSENDPPKDLLNYNESRYLNETSIYCPIAFYDYGVLWEGKSEFSVKCSNKNYYFCKEECSEKFQRDITKYQFYNVPVKKIPAIRLCVTGGSGSGRTSVAKKLAKELGLLHVNFAEYINNFILPKHYKKVGWMYENSFTETQIDEEAVEFQVDEENVNMISDILGNEQELRRMLKNYFEHGVPLISVLMQKIIRKIWFESPFQPTGIVIDGFPKLPSDVEDMITCFCIPNAVIELESNSEIALKRLSTKYFKIWKDQLAEAKNKVAAKIQALKNEWMNFIMRKVVIKLIIDDLLSDVIPDSDEPAINLSTQSTIFDAHPAGSSNVDANLFATYNELIQEYPEPVDQSEWEKGDDALEKINARIESTFETDDENVQALKDILLEQKVKIISVDGKKALEKVFKKVLLKTSYLKNITESFLEQTYIINYDIAEMLLLEGFFLMSKFNRMCPVFIQENPHALCSTFNLSRRQGKLFPVIHRAFIYFISSHENVVKFRQNPIKYIKSDVIKGYRPHALRIGVIGSPKSGKSKLSAKLAKRYGLMCISKGMVLRHILENLHWTDIGLKLNNMLQSGECVNNEIILMAVLTVLMDHRTMSNGFVLDGFPETPYEATELLRYGLYPLIILDLHSNIDTIVKNSQSEVYYDILKIKPPYSIPFITYRYANWYRTAQKIRDWIYNDTQNLHSINGNNSKWQCYVDSCEKIDAIIPKIHYYLTNVKEMIVPIDIFGISNDEFAKKMSVYKNFCPVCLRKNILRHNNFPPDKKGLVQYKNKFYWICAQHYVYVHKYPEILDFENISIPETPAVVKHVNVSLVYEDGICIVTYAENLPSQLIVNGKNEFAASYKGKIYLFCSNKCLDKFLAKPYMYNDITVFKEMHIFPKLSLSQLPNLGYLEQTMGNIMTEACCAVNVTRPKYPGLNVKVSALIYIGLYLKTHNPRLDKSSLNLYIKAFKVFEARAKLMVNIGLRLRSMNNPFNVYPKCCNSKTKIDYVSKKSMSIVSSTIATESDIIKMHHPM